MANEFGQKLRSLRQGAGHSLLGLAKRTNWSKSTIGHAETGVRSPSLELAQALDSALGAGGVLIALAAAARDQRRTTLTAPAMPDWGTDTLADLIYVGRMDVGVNRRSALGAVAYSAAGLVLPGEDWWRELVSRGEKRRPRRSRVVSLADVEAAREMAQTFSRLDQRRGGGHARSALIQYLTSDVAACLTSRFVDDTIRREMFTVASELGYLAGWTAFDSAEHGIAQHHFRSALKLAAEANDAPMAGHVLRAMAHQAIDLGQVKAGLDLATQSLEGQRYKSASARERALLGVVYAKALGASGHKADAAAALIRAEDDLAAAQPGDDEPPRVFFFGEASLAHETACTLRDLGDLSGAAREFRRSVRTRRASSFTRTHAVTLGYLGSVQAQSGSIDEACVTWSQALDAMEGVNSGRTRKIVRQMRNVLSQFRKRGVPSASTLEARAAEYMLRNDSNQWA